MTRGAHLAAEAVQSHRVGHQLLRQELHPDRLAQLQVVGPVHLTHPAAAEQPDNAVTLAKEGTGQEPEVDRGGLRFLGPHHK